MMSDSENKYKVGETGLTMYSSICRCDSCKEEFFADFFENPRYQYYPHCGRMFVSLNHADTENQHKRN